MQSLICYIRVVRIGSQVSKGKNKQGDSIKFEA